MIRMRRRVRILLWLLAVAVLALLAAKLGKLGIGTVSMVLDADKPIADDPEAYETAEPLYEETFPPELMDDSAYDAPEDEFLSGGAQYTEETESPVDQTIEELIREAQQNTGN